MKKARRPAHAPRPRLFLWGVNPARLPGFGVQSRAAAFRCHKQVSASGARGNEWAAKRAKLLLISLSALWGHIGGARVTPVAPISLRQQKSTFVSVEGHSFASRLAQEYKKCSGMLVCLYFKPSISVLLFFLHHCTNYACTHKSTRIKDHWLKELSVW